MKTKKIIFFVLMFLPLVISSVCLFFLPDEFPATSGLNLITTQSGAASKYNALIFPIVSALFGALVPYMIKGSEKEHEGNKANANIIFTVGAALLAFFNVLNIFLLYIAFKGITSLDELPFDIYKVIFISIGVLMVIEGNIMPKVRMNSYLGLRTPWSMKDEDSWKKCQHFCGIAMIVEGIIVILTSAFTTGGICVAICLSVIFFMSLIEMYGSLKIVAKGQKKDNK